MASKRRGGKASAKRQRTAEKVRAKVAAKAQIRRRKADTQETYRTAPIKDPDRNQATGGSSTPRERGLIQSKFGNQSGYSIESDKIKGLEQSIGSLDRRIQTALDKGDDTTAKDLRSRLNKFTTKLGYAKAIQAGGVARDSSGKIMRTSSGNPMMVSSGKDIFDETKREDFGDPTRKFQNEYPDRYKKMYPNIVAKMGAGMANLYGELSPFIGGGIGKFKKPVKEAVTQAKDLVTIGGRVINKVTGLPVVREGFQTAKNFAEAPGGIKNALMKNIKLQPNGIPYFNDIMPGERYPLDPTYGAYKVDPFGGRSRDPNYRQDSFSAPLEEVTISDLVDDQSQPFTDDVVPYIHPAIDINTRNEVFAPDVDDLPANNFNELDAQFQEESNNLNAINNGVDANGNPIDPTELMKLIAAEDAKKEAFANERQNVFYNKDGINVGGEGNLLNAGKELYNLGGYLSGGQLLNKYALEPAANAILGEPPMVPIDQSEFNPDNIDYSQIIETLKGPGYNLKEDMIQELLNSNPDLLNDGNLNSTLSDFYSNR